MDEQLRIALITLLSELAGLVKDLRADMKNYNGNKK